MLMATKIGKDDNLPWALLPLKSHDLVMTYLKRSSDKLKRLYFHHISNYGLKT